MKIRAGVMAVVVWCLVVGSWSEAQAQQDVALWEFGVFSAGARLPHYPGAEEYNVYVLPLPYFIYRGEIIQSDRDGVRGIFFKNDYFESSISLYGNPPVDGDNDAREGMPDLDAIVEIGPAVKWYILGKLPPDSLYVQFAFRAACSIGFDDGIDMAYRGLTGGVNLIYRNMSWFRDLQTAVGMNLGVKWADSEFNGYFYDVDVAYVRSDRPYYQADAGYAGCSAALSLQKRLTDNLSIGGYCRWDNFSGTVFEDSPLLKETNNFVVGAALVWKLFESETRVPMNRISD